MEKSIIFLINWTKVVDAEQKSSRIESFIKDKISNLIDIGDNYSIETSFLIVNQYKTNLTKIPLNISFKDGSSLVMDSLCVFKNEFCLINKSITIKVKTSIFNKNNYTITLNV